MEKESRKEEKEKKEQAVAKVKTDYEEREEKYKELNVRFWHGFLREKIHLSNSPVDTLLKLNLIIIGPSEVHATSGAT